MSKKSVTRTLKEITDDAERRWAKKGYTEKQKQARREHRKFVIHHEGEPVIHRNKDPIARRRLELDHTVDRLNEQRSQREVWDE